MEALLIIFKAIVVGASAAFKPTAEQAVKDAYAGLKALVKKKWSHVEVESLERDPTSQARQDLVKEELQKTKGLEDREVLELAKAVLTAVKQHDSDAASAAGITIQYIEALKNININEILASDGGTSIGKIKAGEDVRIGTIGGNPTRW